jgi:nitrite reductase (NO-forming)
MKALFLLLIPVFLFACSNGDSGSELAASMARGQQGYAARCLTCHMASGAGVPGVYPPLAKSDYLMADRNRAIKQTLYGAQGEMIVNGITYNNAMPSQDLTDQEAADILNYIMNSWGNKAESMVTPEEVLAQRK